MAYSLTMDDIAFQAVIRNEKMKVQAGDFQTDKSGQIYAERICVTNRDDEWVMDITAGEWEELNRMAVSLASRQHPSS